MSNRPTYRDARFSDEQQAYVKLCEKYNEPITWHPETKLPDFESAHAHELVDRERKND